MNVKIQGGGGGTYANSGSCVGVTNYLAHEDLERVKSGKPIEGYFSLNRDDHTPKEVVYQIDKNKAKLCKDDAKFFVITISPSKEEIKAMGKNSKEQSQVFKDYCRGVMNQYAKNFNKDIEGKDILFYGKIHHTRGGKEGEQMHAHIIVSRKDISNTKKLSPMTNHRNTKKGQVKGGFSRDEFADRCERLFDVGLDYKRDFKDSYRYNNIKKNGTVKEMLNIGKSAEEWKAQRSQDRDKMQEQRREQARDRDRERGRGMSR